MITRDNPIRGNTMSDERKGRGGLHGVPITVRIPADIDDELNRVVIRTKMTKSAAVMRYLAIGLDYRVRRHAGGDAVISLHQTLQDITRAASDAAPRWYTSPESFKEIRDQLVAAIDIFAPEEN